MNSRLRNLTSLLALLGALSPEVLAVNDTETEQHVAQVLLAQTYRPGIDPGAYLVSEKLDGVRALWDGKHLRFRSGRLIAAPTWFTADFPDHAMDGELWMGRRSFDLTSAATRRLQPLDSEWRQLTYQVFELPDAAGSFEHRLEALKLSAQQAKVSWLQVAPQFAVADEAELQRVLRRYVDLGAEGLMLHRRDALWLTGRSDVLLKLKAYLDAEAKVIAHEPGKGKYQGMMGALLLEMPDGKRFRLGTGFSDADRLAPPELGSTVTYQYRDLTPQGIPKFASFLRLRETE